eukprot:4188089-Prorocentrum_lima.AAC.1
MPHPYVWQHAAPAIPTRRWWWGVPGPNKTRPTAGRRRPHRAAAVGTAPLPDFCVPATLL